MFYIKMADLLICIDNHYEYVKNMCRDYIVEPEAVCSESTEPARADMYIQVSCEDIEKEQEEILEYRKEIETLRKSLKSRQDNIKEKRDKMLRDAREEAHNIISEAKEIADSTIREYNKLKKQNKNPDANKKMEEAAKMIHIIVTDFEAGQVLEGKVVSIKDFGAFLEFAPGKEGMVHISKLSKERVNRVEDVLTLGDVVKVVCLGKDKMGRISFSMKDVAE